MGLLFAGGRAVQQQAKRTQAKNDLAQIVTAINAFYTEYGRYPTSLTPDTTATYGPAGGNTNNLRALKVGLGMIRGLTFGWKRAA